VLDQVDMFFAAQLAGAPGSPTEAELDGEEAFPEAALVCD
jgi:hypothetical protein